MPGIDSFNPLLYSQSPAALEAAKKNKKEERKSKEHCFDNLVDVCGTITMCYKYPLEMFDTKLNSYYIANIMTDFGQLKVIIAQPLFPKNMTGFGIGNVFQHSAYFSKLFAAQ